MRILFTADIHVNQDHLERIMAVTLSENADVLIIGGDIVPHHLPRAHAIDMLQAQAIYIESRLIPEIKELKARKDVTVLLDFGNDDFMANRNLLANYHGGMLNLLHMQKYALTEGVDVIGYMMVPPTPFQRKDWEKPDAKDSPFPAGGRVRLKGYITDKGHIEEVLLDLDDDRTIELDLEKLSGQIDRPFIFVSHCPPYDTPLDMLSTGAHVGSISIKRFIEKWSRRNMLIASLHGHIHESPRVSQSTQVRINEVPVINPGQDLDLQYALLELTDDGDGWDVNILHP